MRRSVYWLLMVLLLAFACETAPEKQPHEQFAEQAWDGFVADSSRITSVGWCVSGMFKDQEAAALIGPQDTSYVLRRQYLDTKDCQAPVLV